MYASEARAFSDGAGCATHGLDDCLCDVTPLQSAVEIRRVPMAERLLELGVDRFNFVKWAEEVTAWMDAQAGLRLVVEA